MKNIFNKFINMDSKKRFIFLLLFSFIFIISFIIIKDIDYKSFIKYQFGYDNVEIVDNTGYLCNKNECFIDNNISEHYIIVKYNTKDVISLNIDSSLYHKYSYVYSDNLIFNDSDIINDTISPISNDIYNSNIGIKYMKITLDNVHMISISTKNQFIYLLEHINYLGCFINALLFSLIISLIISKKKNKLPIIYFLILLLSANIIYGKFIYDHFYFIYQDIGSDTYYQYYPFYYGIVKNLRGFNLSLWNYQNGMGTSLLNNTDWIFEPFSLFTIFNGLIFGENMVASIIIWMQILKIVCIYFISVKYFKLMLKNDNTVYLCSYLVSMSGFLSLWGQHYFMGTASFFMMLVLYSIENHLQKNNNKSGLLLTIAIALLLIYSFYTGYMILLTIAIYYLYRLLTINKFNIKDISIKGSKTLFYVINGLLLSGIIFIPATNYILTNSSRVSGNTINLISKITSSFNASFDYTYIMRILGRLMSNNMLFINVFDNLRTNYYELPQYSCTFFIFFFLIEYIIYKYKDNKKHLLRFIISILLLYIMIFNQVSGLIMNAFTYSMNRYTFVIIPFIILAIGVVIEEVILKKNIHLSSILIGLIITIYTWYYSYSNASYEVHRYLLIMLISIIIGYILLLLLKYYKKDNYNILIYSFIILIMVNITYDNYITNNSRLIYRKNRFNYNLQLLNDTNKALDYLKDIDKSYYRVDYTYEIHQKMSDAYFTGTSGISWYNSTPNSNVSLYFDKILTSAGDRLAFKSTKYQNSYDLIGSSLLNVKYILSYNDLNINGVKLIKTINNIKIYQNNYTNSIAKWYSKGISKDKFESLSKEEKLLVLEDTIILDNDIDYNNSNGIIKTFNLINGNVIKGNVIADDKGILMLSIPYEDGWEIYVDDIKVNTFIGDYAFYSINLDKGNHDIRIEYKWPKGNIGLISSIIGLVLLLAQIIVIRKEKKDGEKSNENK